MRKHPINPSKFTLSLTMDLLPQMTHGDVVSGVAGCVAFVKKAGDAALNAVKELPCVERDRVIYELARAYPRALKDLRRCDSCGTLVHVDDITEDCESYKNYTENCCSRCVTHCPCGEDYAPSGAYHHETCARTYKRCFCGKIHRVSGDSHSACVVHVAYVRGPTLHNVRGPRVKCRAAFEDGAVPEGTPDFFFSVADSSEDILRAATDILKAHGQDLDELAKKDDVPRDTIAVAWLHGAQEIPRTTGAYIECDKDIDWDDYTETNHLTLTFLGPDETSRDARSYASSIASEDDDENVDADADANVDADMVAAGSKRHREEQQSEDAEADAEAEPKC